MMIQQVQRIVESELEILPEGDLRWDEHRKVVLQHTIGRQWHFIRGSRMRGDNNTEEEELRRSDLHRMNLIDKFVNGDWRLGRLQHVERGCCRTPQEQVQNVTAAIIEGGLIMGLNADRPAANRWGSVGHHLAQQSAGHMAHNILSRTLQASFPKWDSAGVEPDVAEAEDYRKWLRQKTWRSVRCCSSPPAAKVSRPGQLRHGAGGPLAFEVAEDGRTWFFFDRCDMAAHRSILGCAESIRRDAGS